MRPAGRERPSARERAASLLEPRHRRLGLGHPLALNGARVIPRYCLADCCQTTVPLVSM